MKVAVVSLRFAPGHIAHLRAYKALFKAMGYEAFLFLAKGYDGFIESASDIRFIDNGDPVLEWNPDLVFSYNVSEKNIPLAKKCNMSKIPFYYVLHEPWVSIKEFFGEKGRMPRRIMANLVNYITCKRAYKVLLASENGKEKYERYMGACNKRYDVFPLIFCDDYDEETVVNREFFSFIGGFTDSRGCNEFLNFIKYAANKGEKIRFLIATRTDLNITDNTLLRLIENGTLIVCSGKPMTSDEINQHYRESICVWNAYKNSTQSGVLANALMQGAPVLVTKRGDTSKVVKDKAQGFYISSEYKNEEILEALNYINSHLDIMVFNARERFLHNFYYKAFVEKAKGVFEFSN